MTFSEMNIQQMSRGPETSKMHMMADLVENFHYSAIAVDFYSRKAETLQRVNKDLGAEIVYLKRHIERLEKLQKYAIVVTRYNL